MTCPAVNPTLRESHCYTFILSRRTGQEFAHCRACARGLALMATVRDHLPEQFFKDLPERPEPYIPIMEDVMPAPHKNYTQGEIARLAGIKSGSMTYAMGVILRGKTLTPAAQKVKDVLDRVGITAQELVGQAPPASLPPSTHDATDAADHIADGGKMVDMPEPAAPTPLRNSMDETMPFLSEAMSLEDLFGELKRRLPGVAITFTI